MPHFSINYLAEMTGRTNRTIKAKLDGMEPSGKEGRAVLYESKEALARVFDFGKEGNPDEITLEEARRNESVAKTEKLHLEMESIRKQRIPIEIVNETLEEYMGAMKSVVKRSKLTPEEKDELFREAREVPRRLKW